MKASANLAYSVWVSNATDGTISTYHLDAETGAISPTEQHPAGDAVMPLTRTTNRKWLYAATRGPVPTVATYTVSDAGQLTPHRTTPISSNLAYLSASPNGDYLLGASYGEHRISLYHVNASGEVDGEAKQFIGDIRNAHSILISPDGAFAYVASLGSDRVFVFAITHTTTGPQLQQQQVVNVPEGFGPRHLRFSPDTQRLYVVSEFRAQVGVFARDTTNGTISELTLSPRPASLAHMADGAPRPPVSSIPTPPGIPAPPIWAADIQITPDERFVFVSERTASQIITFSIAPDGTLSDTSTIDTETQPRGIRLTPNGRFLLACGEKSPHISVYAINPSTGALSPVARCEGGMGANWIEITEA